ncbi:glutamate-1-semialdehyde 2,1-aminomutase [Cyclonatronum proteinivorum]|uniref:Glutamate-1-semialdehyde 2,1-aminomutase n=1 Tax=Cyclonatronum proteinivorum TaxID=1457365 RepID=A0A345UNK2_9BACT|nr:glutamate-1-semialdehyde 2,1-aminomutase [Cyclonatronum proteinivorum]AXJ02054.1 glutamate-1-semialdehyde 2,1-aminomutase [Cyclonatronum proteinivorum]
MYEKSEVLFKRAQQFIPGGVNSPVRAFKAVGGTPVFFERAEGSVLYDADGNSYIDYVGSWGPMLLGHAWPPVVKAVQDAAARSTSFGAPTELEIELAELIQQMVPGLDKVRMVNSGTEACMSAIRVARGYTERDKIIKFEGNYHGHGDSFLIKAGSGAMTFGTPSSPGVTKGTAQDTLTANFNDIEDVKRLFAENKGQVAALIIEPIAGNMGCVPPADGFLQGLRDICTAEGAILIFDEVMCGFRVAPGGAQQLYGVQADLVTFGKIIGAGLPVGAYGGKEEIMNVVSPVGPVYQAGTLSGNPLAMSAGLALLSELHKNPSVYEELEHKTAHLEEWLHRVFKHHEITHSFNRVGSMLGIFFCEGPVTDFESCAKTDVEFFGKFFHGMLKRGVYLPPSAFESLFLSNAITQVQLDHTVNAADETVEELIQQAQHKG